MPAIEPPVGTDARRVDFDKTTDSPNNRVVATAHDRCERSINNQQTRSQHSHEANGGAALAGEDSGLEAHEVCLRKTKTARVFASSVFVSSQRGSANRLSPFNPLLASGCCASR